MTDELRSESPRKIIHLDMDCFYAAVELRDHPELVGRPIAVGGPADRRGVISTCNYEARDFGVHSAMATAYALRLCPSLIVLPGRMSLYKSVSTQIREIMNRYTDIIEPLSLDEAFLDVTDAKHFQGSATLIAEDIRRAIFQELNLTASAGIAPNKFLAKICSDENKPNGQCVVTPDGIEQFVMTLPLKKIPGVGKVTVKKLKQHGLETCADVRALGKAELLRSFGKFGELLFKRSYGIDDRPLTTHWIRKSMSVEHTFSQDILDLVDTQTPLVTLFGELERRLAKYEKRPIRNQQVKLKFSDFKTTTIERSSSKLDIALFKELLPLAWDRGDGLGIRLLGLGVTFREMQNDAAMRQLVLF